ncbi:MAG: FAD-binding oxidoreductase [Spongiibacter sp.]|nr:FAD-binding oxidoreductase [Spongiibacter sp.]
MPTLFFDGQAYQLRDGESVLHCLLRHQCRIPHSCQAGICQSCVMEERPPSAQLRKAQSGLSDRQQQQGAFLSCRLVPSSDMTIALPQRRNTWLDAHLTGREQLGDDFYTVTLSARCTWQPGQYFALSCEGHHQRFFSPIGSASAGDLTLLLRYRRNGAISSRLIRGMAIGDTIQLRGPLGNFLLDERDDGRPILFLGEGTGIAPLLSMAERVREQDEQRVMHFLATAEQSEFAAALESLGHHRDGAASFPRWLSPESIADGVAALGPLSEFVVYLCGSLSFIQHWQRHCFLKGAARPRIHTETFLDLSAVE